ncbi:MAG: hypothetical protein RL145_2298 [Pseudomonadota bacterium]|jgi:predicted nucleic acid-binding Zn ribbon protein
MTECLECGQPTSTVARFCTTTCRHNFNNRRKARGATVYDLFMAMRYQRALATKWQVWLMMTRLAKAWRDEDRERRAARISWNSPEIALRDACWLRHQGNSNMSRRVLTKVGMGATVQS